MTVEELVASIALWVGANAEADPGFLSPQPRWSVDAGALLDHVAAETGIGEEEIGLWVDEGRKDSLQS